MSESDDQGRSPDHDARTARGMTAAQALDRIETATHGPRPGYRRLHARGSVFRGTFTPSGTLASLTRAPHLTTTPTEVLVRFSNGSSDPGAPDTEPGVRGMAVRFLGDGQQPVHDLVAATFRVFASRNPEGFVELVEVLGVAEPTASPVRRALRVPGQVAGFAGLLARHPESRASMREFGARRVQASYATTRYDGIHAYILVAADGRRSAYRYRWIPDAGEVDLPKPPPAGITPRFLLDELRDRLAAGPVGFTLAFQMAAADDRTDDPSRAWPEDRKIVVGGALSVTGAHTDSSTLESSLVFDPTLVPDGVDLSDDPVLRFRGSVYRLAGSRRTAGG